MKNYKILWSIIVTLLIIVGILSFSLFKTETMIISEKISSFEECAAAGYPILEIYPEQCNTPDGKNFVNNVPGRPIEILPINDSDNVVCTMEAKECPDGSYVGRTGPKCEFTACPK